MPYAIDSSGQSLPTAPTTATTNDFIAAWRERRPFYRRDLAAADGYDEQTHLQDSYGGGIRSVLDVPFAHGTLAINSR
jgi:hypothetical protein